MPGEAPEFARRYGPWALVAGASEGIGAAFARALAQRGLDLVLVARRDEPLRALAEELTARAGVQARCLPLDLARADAAARLEQELRDLEVGLLVYNAARAPVGAFLELPLEDQLAVLDVNARSPLSLAHGLGRRMAARGRGAIVLLSSLTAFQGSPFVATYGASKSFLLALGEALWYELAPRGVDVLTVLAGATRTPSYLRQRAERGAPGELEPEQVAHEALARLGAGPAMIPGRFNRFASQLMRRLLSRRATIRLMGGQTRRLVDRS
jgi:short-subunit dehydrogenase